MAEREGFEPSIGVKAYTPLAGERLQPLGHLSEEGILYCNYIERVFRNRPFDKYYFTISKSWEMEAVFPNIIDAEQYFSADSVIAFSTFFESKSCPFKMN